MGDSENRKGLPFAWIISILVGFIEAIRILATPHEFGEGGTNLIVAPIGAIVAAVICRIGIWLFLFLFRFLLSGIFGFFGGVKEGLKTEKSD